MSNCEGFEIEIGCGKGKFLIARAEKNPHRFFLGIDRSKKWMRRGMQRKINRGLTNLLFVKGDIQKLLQLPIFKNNISIFHIYFPDPWPKRKHHKRRLLRADFFKCLYECLEPKGCVELATDFEDYFQSIQRELRQAGLAWKSEQMSHERKFEPELKTNYELKYEKEGRRLFYLTLCKP